jgi:hypothetical protein
MHRLPSNPVDRKTMLLACCSFAAVLATIAFSDTENPNNARNVMTVIAMGGSTTTHAYEKIKGLTDDINHWVPVASSGLLFVASTLLMIGEVRAKQDASSPLAYLTFSVFMAASLAGMVFASVKDKLFPRIADTLEELQPSKEAKFASVAVPALALLGSFIFLVAQIVARAEGHANAGMRAVAASGFLITTGAAMMQAVRDLKRYPQPVLLDADAPLIAAPGR